MISYQSMAMAIGVTNLSDEELQQLADEAMAECEEDCPRLVEFLGRFEAKCKARSDEVTEHPPECVCVDCVPEQHDGPRLGEFLGRFEAK